jgi:hypothetical protein
MKVRMLSAHASDFAKMNASELTESIRAARGRTLAVEVICTYQSPVDDVTHGEIAAGMGADIIVLDRYDSLNPDINNAPSEIISAQAPLKEYKRLLGRPVGINMVVADPKVDSQLSGRLVNDTNVERAVTQGTDIIFLYSRPQIGGTPNKMKMAAKAIYQQHGENVMIVGVPSFTTPPPRTSDMAMLFSQETKALLDAGCHAIGLPMPGSHQGWQLEFTADVINSIHQDGGLAWLFVTGSVEGSPKEMLVQMALNSKMLGADAYRLDEAGLSGMPLPENILTFSLAIRGARHTYWRMASSILR